MIGVEEVVLGRSCVERVGRRTLEQEGSKRGSVGGLRCWGTTSAATRRKRRRSAAGLGRRSEGSTAGRRELEVDRKGTLEAVDADGTAAEVAVEGAEEVEEPKSTRRELSLEEEESCRRRRNPICRDAGQLLARGSEEG